MIKQLDHIAIKVGNITELCRVFEDLGLCCTDIGQYDEVGMRIAFLGNSETHLELLEVTNKTSPIANDKAGLHHLGIKVKNIEEVYKKMNESEQFQVLGDIRQGAHSRIFFFKMTEQEEILFECVE
ncbi:MAG TPA: VOC family protein [Candidatus Deferrimicrobium sp.]|nr:VOC family protein [Candidatus Kapabacteria bacterium]HLP59843.1 VOC family protein [Candidatus Deferrimicrobium sp.]